jgi:hypothetical protein
MNDAVCSPAAGQLSAAGGGQGDTHTWPVLPVVFFSASPPRVAPTCRDFHLTFGAPQLATGHMESGNGSVGRTAGEFCIRPNKMAANVELSWRRLASTR